MPTCKFRSITRSVRKFVEAFHMNAHVPQTNPNMHVQVELVDMYLNLPTQDQIKVGTVTVFPKLFYKYLLHP